MRYWVVDRRGLAVYQTETLANAVQRRQAIGEKFADIWDSETLAWVTGRYGKGK